MTVQGGQFGDRNLQVNVFGRRAAQTRHPYLSTVREMAERTPELVDRDADIEALRAFSTSSQVYRWIAAPPWAGKTALAAHFLLQLSPDVDWAAFFLVQRLSEADSSQYIATLNGQLAYILGEEPPASPQALATYRDLWEAVVRRSARLRRHFVLVVDGLDEDISRRAGRVSIGALIPVVRSDPEFVHILVTSRAGQGLPDDVGLDHPLRGIQIIEIASSRAGAERGAEARQELDLLLRDHDPGDLENDVLGVLSAAQGRMTAADVAGVLGNPDPRSVRRVQRVLTDFLRRTLTIEGEGPYRRYSFGHQSLLVAAQSADPEGEERRAVFSAWMRRFADQGWRGAPLFAFDDYPGWVTAHEPDSLGALLSDVSYLESAVAAIGVDRLVQTMYAATVIAPELETLTRCMTDQAFHLRSARDTGELTGSVARQLSLAALHLGDRTLHSRLRDHLHRLGGGINAEVASLIARDTGRTTLRGNQERVSAVAINADGSVGLTGGGSVPLTKGRFTGELLLWNLAARVPSFRSLAGHETEVRAVALSDAGTVGVSSDGRGVVLLWRFDGEEPLAEPLPGTYSYERRIALTADGSRVVVAGGDTLDIYTVDGPSVERRSYACPHNDIRYLAVNEDATMIVVGIFGGTVVGWTVDPAASSVDEWPEFCRGTATVRSLALSRAGDALLVGVGDMHGNGALYHSRLPTTALIKVEPVAFAVNALTVDAGGRTAVAAGGWIFARGHMVTLDLTSSRVEAKPIDLDDVGIDAAAISGDGRSLLTASFHRLSLWDLRADHALPNVAHEGKVWSVAVARDGLHAVSCALDSLIVWRITDGEMVGESLRRDELQFTRIAADSDLDLVLIGSSMAGPWAISRLAETSPEPRLEQELSGRSGGASVGVSPNGRYAVANAERRLVWWSPGVTGIYDLSSWIIDVDDLWVSDSGLVLADEWWSDGWTTTEHTLVLWQIQPDGTVDRLLSHELPQDCDNLLAVSADLDLVAANGGVSGENSVFVDLWTLRGTTPTRRRIATHRGSVSAAALSADGHLLASCDSTGEFLVHDVGTGRLLQRTLVETEFTAMRFGAGASPWLVAGDRSGNVTLWKITGGPTG
ncbi:WD40 repeat domain-containing protein [Dactylosporangium sp. NPDC000521]|uniref:WD40 repeat domain-containing protein n=1 Tax=Dactylosporangium sp. NPDC000521 TaxID=3363975 RepID=UPI0036B56E9C